MSDEEMSRESYRMLVEVHTQVCGKGGLNDRLEKVEEAQAKSSKTVAWLGGGIGALSSWAAFKDKIAQLLQ